jgi:hypothetical protein
MSSLLLLPSRLLNLKLLRLHCIEIRLTEWHQRGRGFFSCCVVRLSSLVCIPFRSLFVIPAARFTLCQSSRRHPCVRWQHPSCSALTGISIFKHCHHVQLLQLKKSSFSLLLFSLCVCRSSLALLICKTLCHASTHSLFVSSSLCSAPLKSLFAATADSRRRRRRRRRRRSSSSKHAADVTAVNEPNHYCFSPRSKTSRFVWYAAKITNRNA